MRIQEVQTWREPIELSRPYSIAFKSTDRIDLFFVRIVTERGSVGVGAAAPVEQITGESLDDCEQALGSPAGQRWVGQDPREFERLLRQLEADLPNTPAARAALDIALHDLFARHLGLPLVDYLGRAHDALPTSITIGIKSVEETLTEAEEYVGRGFRYLKVKLGLDIEEDEARLRQLRERYGSDVFIRVDANQGYSVEETRRAARWISDYGLEFIEQPLPGEAVADMLGLPETVRQGMAADESLHGPANALELIREPQPFGIFNIKLMKCGGIRPALQIARLAHQSGIGLMWGCMDESCVSIAAALHAALASPATRYLDLDGSLDLARDLFTMGFQLEEGVLRTVNLPGLGVRPVG